MKVKKGVILLCLLLMLTIVPLSQAHTHYSTINMQNTWMQTYGRLFNDELGSSIQQTKDGGFIVVGSKSTSLFDIHGHRDVWLLKLNETGTVMWDQTYGGPDEDDGNAVQQTDDGGYIIVGRTRSYSNGKTDVWLIKTDEKGNKLWDTTFGYSDFDSGSEVRQTRDGCYVIIGSGNQSGGGRGEALLIKVDSDGNKVWARSFGEKGHNYADEIQQTSDDGFIIIGSSWISGETNSYDMWLIKTDKDGNLMWDKKFDGAGSDHGWSIGQTLDGGFIITGETYQSHGSDDNIWLVKTDENGNTQWENTFEGRGYSSQQTSDGGFIIAGATMNSTITDFSNGLLMKTDSGGNLEWRRTFGGRQPDFFFSVQQTQDNGYVLTGYTIPWHFWFGSDLWVLKTDSEGKISLQS